MISEIKSDKKLDKELLYDYWAIFRKAITFDMTSLKSKLQNHRPYWDVSEQAIFASRGFLFLKFA